MYLKGSLLFFYRFISSSNVSIVNYSENYYIDFLICLFRKKRLQEDIRSSWVHSVYGGGRCTGRWATRDAQDD